MGIGILFIGFCVGSFLNVAIYRIPRGLSVNEPKRSFCPHCKTTLPAWQNIPIFTWLLQRGKCKTCSAPIAVRYLIVEVMTGLLYYAAWRNLPMTSAILTMIMLTVLVTISYIDAEHQVIPITWTGAASVIALVGGLFQPQLLNLARESQIDSGLQGMAFAATGWVAGFGSLFVVVLLGKLVWGRKKMTFDKATSWKLHEGWEDNPQLHWVLGDEAYSWDDLFFRDSDELIIDGYGFQVNGKSAPGKQLLVKRNDFSIGEKRWSIEKLKSLEGKATSVVIPREAMGMGDPHLLGMIGAFLGWPAVFFTIFVSSIYAIVAAIITRVGFGKPLPYGPFLALAALTWVFGGWELWVWYFQILLISNT
ncbi:prepilin peptidase [Akkermansiaceae bacterium]|nr:prepilin peptidase [Akkermansiaceae bacterium]